MADNKSKLISNQLSFCVLGAIEAAWAPMVPFVKSDLGLNDAQFGNMLFAMGVGSICALPGVGPLISKFGPRLVAFIGGIALGLSLVGISISDSALLLPILLAIFGASLIFMDVASNVNAVVVEKLFKRPLMSGFHGGYSLGTIIGALLMTLLLNMHLDITVSAVVVFIVMVGGMFIFCRSLERDVSAFNEKQKQTDDHMQHKRFYIPPAILVLGLLCFIMYGSEGALLSWSTVFATQNRGIDPTVAGYFYLFFAVAMTSVRLLGNKIVTKFGRRKTVVTGAVAVCLGFVIAAIVESQIGMMVGFALVGLGAGNIVPQLVSFTGSIKGMKVQSAISLINALGYSGVLLGPVIIGHVSNMSSLEVSFEVLGAAVFAVAVISFFLLKVKKD